jgi:nitroreductase
MKTEKADFIPYSGERFNEKEMLIRSSSFYEWASTRRSVRQFSERPVSLEVMQNLILTASTAPSGAHKQPWTFCLISNKELKTELRRLAEEEEQMYFLDMRTFRKLQQYISLLAFRLHKNTNKSK